MRFTVHETHQRVFTVKIRGINVAQDGIIHTDGPVAIYTPPAQRRFAVLECFGKLREVAGTPTDTGEITLTDGTNEVVTTKDIGNTDAECIRFTVDTGDHYIDHDHPLTLVCDQDITGATAALLDLVVVLLELSGQ